MDQLTYCCRFTTFWKQISCGKTLSEAERDSSGWGGVMMSLHVSIRLSLSSIIKLDLYVLMNRYCKSLIKKHQCLRKRNWSMSLQLVELLTIPPFTCSSPPLALHPTFKCTLVVSILYNVSNYVASVQWAYTVLLKCSVSQKSRKIAHNHSLTGL